MKLTIRDIPNAVFAPRRLQLAKPIIDLDTAPYAVTLLRVSLGMLFLAHGCLKVFTFTRPGTAQVFESVGLPGFMAYGVAPMESSVGGLLLIVGLHSRWVALLLFPLPGTGCLPMRVAAGNFRHFARLQPCSSFCWAMEPMP